MQTKKNKTVRKWLKLWFDILCITIIAIGLAGIIALGIAVMAISYNVSTFALVVGSCILAALIVLGAVVYDHIKNKRKPVKSGPQMPEHPNCRCSMRGFFN